MFFQNPKVVLSVIFKKYKNKDISDSNMLVASYIENFEQKKGNSPFRNIANYFNRHPIVYGFLAGSATLYFTFFPLLKSVFDIENSNVGFSQSFRNIEIIVLIISAFMIIVKAFADKYDFAVKKTGALIYQELYNFSSKSRNTKISKYKSIINDSRKVSFCKEIKPEDHVLNVINEFSNTMGKVLGVKENQFGVIVLYRFPQSSRFNRISNKTGGSLIYENKLAGHDSIIPDNVKDSSNPEYMTATQIKTFFDTRSIPNNNVVSFYCQNIRIELSKSSIDAYIVFYTHDYMMFTSKDKNSFEKFKTIIVPSLVDQIQLEILKLYISDSDKCPLRSKKINTTKTRRIRINKRKNV